MVFKLGQRRRVRIGHFGLFSFPTGYYVYTGSALQGLESRIARHLRRKRRMR